LKYPILKLCNRKVYYAIITTNPTDSLPWVFLLSLAGEELIVGQVEVLWSGQVIEQA
jgi:hypothetical protein